MADVKVMTERQKMALLATQRKPAELRALFTPAELRALFTPGELLAWFTPAELRAWFTPGELLAWFTPDELRAWFTPAELRAWFTPAELEKYEQEWNSIPIIDKPYTRLLAAIQSGDRKHNQSTFGPDCDPKTNLCKTPMCTAGHFVNMAGEIGYALKKKYDWRTAAGMVHRKSRPDVEPQNFGSIPQKFAMAYIEERAAEEQAEGFEERLAAIRSAEEVAS